jgi:hypothetical protein
VAGQPKPKLRKPPPTAARITARRRASKIPETARYVPKWLLVVDMLDELASWGTGRPIMARCWSPTPAKARQQRSGRH